MDWQDRNRILPQKVLIHPHQIPDQRLNRNPLLPVQWIVFMFR